MATLGRFCKHGNLRLTCKECKHETVQDAEVRAAENRARGESHAHNRVEVPVLHYPWEREAFESWQNAGRSGLAAISPGLPLDDLPFAVVADFVNDHPTSNILLVCNVPDVEKVQRRLHQMNLEPSGLIDHHFMEPREEGVLLLVDLEELQTVDLSTWGRFASTGLLVLMDADGVNQATGHVLLDTPFQERFCMSRQPSAMDLLISRPWVRAFGPLVYRYTEEQARDVGMLPRIQYRLHVEMLRPDKEDSTLEGPWDPTDIPTRLPSLKAGAFMKGRARDVALECCAAMQGMIVIHDGVAVKGASVTTTLADLPKEYDPKPSGWVLADPTQDATVLLRIAKLAAQVAGGPDAPAQRIEDAVVLPVPADLCHIPPWQEKWQSAAVQLDRACVGMLLAESPGDVLDVEELEALVGVALALRGLPPDDLYKLTPVVTEAAAAAHEDKPVKPERILAASRSHGGVAAALLVAAEGGPSALLQLAHPGFTPTTPDLPHPALYDARRHGWRGRAFKALAQAATRHDLVTAWGHYPELRFLFPSSLLLEVATEYCRNHRLKGPLDELNLRHIEDKTRIEEGDRDKAFGVLKEWSDALSLAEEQERAFLADMHARQPERERRREGVALPGLWVKHHDKSKAVFEAQGGRLPRTNISPGSEVAIVEAGGKGKHQKELGRGLVSRLEHRRITIEFPNEAPYRYPKQVTVNLVFDAKVFEAYDTANLGAIRALTATTRVDDGPDGLIRACLLGETAPPAAMQQSLDVPTLTPSQRAANEAVLSGGRVKLVHGPPGTGKTHTLVHLAMALTRAGHSVLVTADSNAAVDNMVVGLRRSGALVVRVAHSPNIRDPAAEPARIDPMEAPPFVRWAGQQGIVVATTNYGAFRYLDRPGSTSPYLFDYVIHDEAGQSTAPSSLAAVMRGRRLVLAGDPLQLPPTVVSLDAKEAGLDVTLFDRIQDLTGADRTTMLATQFRMRPEIVRFSNERYYEGKIETAASVAEQDILSEVPALAFQHVTGRENPRARNGSISNDHEVRAVQDLIGQMAPEIRDKGWTFAVLTPYQAQREKMRRAMPDVEVSTVDGAQGREWDVVFYSSVRSNPKHRLGFLSDERRLNVAVTRARRNFILVGDERTLRSGPGFDQLLDLTEKIRRHWPDPTKKPGPPGKAVGKPRGSPGKRGKGGRRSKGKPDRGQNGEQDRGPSGKGRKRRRRGRRRSRPDDQQGDSEHISAQDGRPQRPGRGAHGKDDADGAQPAKKRASGQASGSAAKGRPRKKDAPSGRPKNADPAKGDGGSQQCTATTQSGSRCKRKAKPGSNRCAQHQ